MTGRSKNIFVFCPGCKQELRIRAFCSGAPIWSDGFCGTKVSSQCELSVCPLCQHSFWIKDAEKLAKVAEPTLRGMFQTDRIFAAFGWGEVLEQHSSDNEDTPAETERFAESAGNDLLIAVLQTGALEPEREYSVRKEIWHRGNHAVRGIAFEAADQIPENIRFDNLRWLLSKNEGKPSDDRDVVIEAELMRELGRFDEALERIQQAYWGGATRALIIHSQADARNASVCVVQDTVPIVIY